EARERRLALSPVEGFDSETGMGVRGTVDGHALLLGNTALMRGAGVDVQALAGRAEALRRDGASVMYLAVDGGLAGLVAVADPIKPDTPAALDALRAEGLRVVMATGDGLGTAEAVACQLGISEVHGEGSPAGKPALGAALKRGGRRVAMAGD